MQIEWSKCMRKGEFRLRNLSQSLSYIIILLERHHFPSRA